MTESETSVSANYDESWKVAIEKYFEAFVAFFFPEAHREIAWERGYEFLDKELNQIVRDAEIGKRFVDKLLKVWLVNGEEAWLLLHIEIQSQTDSGFAKRMFTYHYRIFDRYGREVVSLAVLGDEQPNWRPTEYGYGRWGCEMRLRFPVIKLLDYTWESLEASNNPFAVVVMAHRKTQATTQAATERLQWKLRLIKGLYRRGYSRQDILEIFGILDRMMGLPEPLEVTFRDDLRQFEEENQMPYISSIERIGRQEKAKGLIQSLLKSRFGVLDEELSLIVEPLTQLSDDEVANLLLTSSREELVTRFGQSTLH
ncbi:transposase [Scytonema sp. UIC 10036]|uniref:transposase n=1 Tax=Scytonema sp. UIC 10036 TaxID=2304196 RepID=UPI0012DA8D97|nr:transposase [Scytonema sp. UIC 10036]MUG98508.1 transposase [Scytonema sp. UIC 10036]